MRADIQEGTPETKRSIMEICGSTFSLKDGKVSIEAKKPLRRILECTSIPLLCPALDDVRTFYMNKDEETVNMVDNIKKLVEMIEPEQLKQKSCKRAA